MGSPPRRPSEETRMSPKPLVAAIAATLVMMSAARAAEQAPAGDKAVDLDKVKVKDRGLIR